MADKRTLAILAAVVLFLVTVGAAFLVLRFYLGDGDLPGVGANSVSSATAAPAGGAALEPGGWALPDFSKIAPRFSSADFGRDSVIMDKPNGKVGIEGGVFFIESSPGTWWYWNRPWGNLDADFACEVVGRVASGANGAWSLLITRQGKPVEGIRVTLHANGRIEIARSAIVEPKVAETHVGPFADPAIKLGTEYNRVMVVLHGQELLVFVNGVSVCDPVRIQQRLLPAIISLSGTGGAEGSRVEFMDCRAWWVGN